MTMATPKKQIVLQNPLQTAQLLMRGELRFFQTMDMNEHLEKLMKKHPRARISEEQELELWSSFDTLCATLAPKCKFNRDGICNRSERLRRNIMFGVFRLVKFQSQSDQIREVFQRNFGRVSLKWMIECCKTEAPAWYYKWAFDAIPGVMSKTWGPDALVKLVGSDDHRDLFRELEPIKENLLCVKRVMES